MSSSEPQLEAVLAEIVFAQESGRTLSAEEWLARFPQFQSELREFLSLRCGFERISLPLRAELGSTLRLRNDDANDVSESKSSFPMAFGRYLLLGELGHGGMGVVTRARQDGLEREVALKMIHVGRFASESLKQRFRVEAIAVGRLNHPAIVPVFDVGEVDGQPYYSMQLLDGGDLVANLARIKSDARAAAVVVKELANGIQHAHEHGVLHRDLKPSNILFDRTGKPYLSDFGLAKLLDDDGGLTKSGECLGTPAYLAPELVRGTAESAASTATDVYGLGAIFFFALAGKPPFSGTSPLAVLEQVRTADVPSIQKLRPDIPRDLMTICDKCLERDPRRRYVSAQALAVDLRHWLANEPICARPTGRIEVARKWAVRKPALAALVAVTVVAAISMITGALWHYESMRQSLQYLDALRAAGQVREANLRELLYASDMRAAKRAFDCGDFPHFDELLQRQRPLPSMPEVRGWEWHLLAKSRQAKPIVVWKGHDAGILRSAVSPDGRMLATVDRRGQVRIWDTSNHSQLAGWSYGSQEVNYVAFSPDGKTLATCGQDRTLRLWKVGEWSQLAVLQGHERTVTGLAYSPDGATIATCGRDFHIVFWDVASQSLRRKWQAHADVVQAVAWSPDGKTLASCGSDALVKLWDFASSGCRNTFVCPYQRTLLTVAFRPDGGSILAAGYSPEIFQWNLKTDQPQHFQAQTSTIFSMAFGANGVLLTPGSNHHLVAWNFNDPGAKPESIRCVDFSQSPFRAVAPIPNSNQFFLACDRGEIQRWDLGSLLLEQTQQVSDRIVAFAGDGIGSVRVDELGYLNFCKVDQVKFKVAGHKASVRIGVYSGDSSHFATGADDGTVKIWDVDGNLLQSINESIAAHNGISLDSTGHKLAHCNQEGEVKIWTVGSAIPRVMEKGAGVVFAPDGRMLAVIAENKRQVALFDVETGKTNRAFPASQPVFQVAFVRNACIMICFGWDGTMEFWETESGKNLGRIHESAVGGFADVSIAPDGRTIATIAPKGPLRLWNVATREELFVLRNYCRGSQGQRVCFANDGSLRSSEESVSGSAVIRWTLAPPL